jgi:hypothetical protein
VAVVGLLKPPGAGRADGVPAPPTDRRPRARPDWTRPQAPGLGPRRGLNTRNGSHFKITGHIFRFATHRRCRAASISVTVG